MPRNGHKSLGRRVRLVILACELQSRPSRSIEEDVPTLTGSPRQQSHPRAPCASTCSKWTCRRFVARSPRRARASVQRARRARSRATKPTISSPPRDDDHGAPPKRSRTTRAVASSLWDARSSRSCPTLARRTLGFCRTSSPPRPPRCWRTSTVRQPRLGFLVSVSQGLARAAQSPSKRHRRRRLRHHREDHRGGIQQTADERTRRGRGRGRGRPRGRGRGDAQDGCVVRIRSLFGGSREDLRARAVEVLVAPVADDNSGDSKLETPSMSQVRSLRFDAEVPGSTRASWIISRSRRRRQRGRGIRRRGGTTPPWCPKGDWSTPYAPAPRPPISTSEGESCTSAS